MEKQLYNMLNSIRLPIIYYIPHRLFNDLSEKEINGLKSIQFLDSLLLIDAKGNAKEMRNRIEQIELIKKERILKSNTFELLRLKGSLDKNAFNYLLSAYSKELNTWVRATQFIKQEAVNDADNYFPKLQAYLDLQHNVLKQHQDELIKHFRKWKIQFETERVFKMPWPDENQIKKILKTSSQESKSKQIPKTISKLKKHKKALMSDKEADDYLLKTVFNVDFLATKQ